jgi:hypothetical protein
MGCDVPSGHMAWQVLLLRLPQTASLATLPVDYVAPAIGYAPNVAARIREAALRACVTAETDGERLVVLRTADFVIEAELGGVAAVDRVLLKILGSDAALPLVCTLARALETSAIDCETDMVLDESAAIPDTLRQWQTRVDELR